jgi:hypothetical protein
MAVGQSDGGGTGWWGIVLNWGWFRRAGREGLNCGEMDEDKNGGNNWQNVGLVYIIGGQVVKN